VRRQLSPTGFSTSFWTSVIVYVKPLTPENEASVPAGAFQTPSCASVRAMMPATAPQGAKSSRRFLNKGSGMRSRGK